jgi:HSP20 family protein
MAKTWAELKAERDERMGTKLEDTAGYRRTMVALATGEAIREARLHAGLTQKALADRMGTSQPQVARLEAGHTSAKVETLAKVIEATGAQMLLSPTPDGDIAVSLATPGHAEPPAAVTAAGWQPAVDISKDNASLVIEVDLPGLDPDKIDVEIADDALHIGGTSGTARPHGATYVAERKSGQFERTVMLPEGVDPSRVDARYDNGVLTVTVALEEPGTAPLRGTKSRKTNASRTSGRHLTPIAVTH